MNNKITKKKKEYSRPFMFLENFIPSSFVASCDEYQAVYTGTEVVFDGSGNKLYHDTNDNKNYNSGEQVSTPAPPSDNTFVFSFSENESLNYMMLGMVSGKPALRNICNIKPYSNHKYYYDYDSSYPYGYRNTSQVQNLYALKATNNLTYYFRGNSFTITKLPS